MSRQWRLAARPVGKVRDSDFELVEVPVPEPADGQFVVAVSHISLDPAMRGWMNAGRSYVPPVEIGEVMRATCSITAIEQPPIWTRTGSNMVDTRLTSDLSSSRRV